MSDVERILTYHPSYSGKQPLLRGWLEMYRAQTKASELFVIDNTSRLYTEGHTPYLRVLQEAGVPSIHIQPWHDQPMEFTLKHCWELAAARARELDCGWVWSVEADNYCAPNALEVMHSMALYGNCHLVTHDYPAHRAAAEASGAEDPDNSFWYTEFGCMLLSTQLLERALAEYDEHKCMSVAVFRTNEKYRGGHCRLTHAFSVTHEDTWATEFPMFPDPDPDSPIKSVYSAVPEDTGSVTPECMRNLEKECV